MKKISKLWNKSIKNLFPIHLKVEIGCAQNQMGQNMTHLLETMKQ